MRFIIESSKFQSQSFRDIRRAGEQIFRGGSAGEAAGMLSLAFVYVILAGSII